MSEFVLVDSCMWIHALRLKGDRDIKLGIHGLLQEYMALLCGPVELEVLGGAGKHDRKKIKEYFDIMPYRKSDHTIWREAVETSWLLSDQGLSVPWNDTIIATIAKKYGYRVYSEDKHFKMMSEILGIRLYQPGYMGMYNPEG